MSFETALTGLNAAAADLDVTGNNIANSQTTGFKMSRAEFADIFAASSSGVARNAIGQGCGWRQSRSSLPKASLLLLATIWI